MPAWCAGRRFRGACGVRRDDYSLVARLEAGRASAAEVSHAHDHRRRRWRWRWRLGWSASKSPANAVQTAAVRRRQPSRAPRDTGHCGVTRGAEGALRFRDSAAVSEDRDGARRRPRERAQRAHGRRPCRIAARGGDHSVGVSAHPRVAAARQDAAAGGRNAGCGARRGPGYDVGRDSCTTRPSSAVS